MGVGGGGPERAHSTRRGSNSRTYVIYVYLFMYKYDSHITTPLSLSRSLAYRTLSFAHTFSLSLSLHPPSPTSLKCLSQQVQYKIQKAVKTQAHLQPTYKTNNVHLTQSNSKLMQETCSTPLPTTALNPLK